MHDRKYHKRYIETFLGHAAALFPVVVVAGSRQVGKSTLLQHFLAGSATTIVFDPASDVGGARRDPELFLRSRPTPLVLDEVQYAPELLAPLKRLVDERRGEKGLYYLTGSQQFSMLRNVQESLAGRAAMVDLLPMAAGEIEQRPARLLPSLFDLDADGLAAHLGGAPRPSMPLYERLFRGGYPALLDQPVQAAHLWFASYLRTYVERDVSVLRDVSDPHEFTRLFRLLAALTAQELNASQLGREIGISPITARAWLSALEGGFQVLRVDAWSGNTIKRVSGKPKLHLVDTGLAAHLLSVSSPDALGSHPQLGALFESYVVLEIVKQVRALATPAQLWHWRSSGGAEVDLLLERDGVFYPIEVKLASRPDRNALRGIAAFQQTYPTLRLGTKLVVHAGLDVERLAVDAIAVPVHAL